MLCLGPYPGKLGASNEIPDFGRMKVKMISDSRHENVAENAGLKIATTEGVCVMITPLRIRAFGNQG